MYRRVQAPLFRAFACSSTFHAPREASSLRKRRVMPVPLPRQRRDTPPPAPFSYGPPSFFLCSENFQLISRRESMSRTSFPRFSQDRTFSFFFYELTPLTCEVETSSFPLLFFWREAFFFSCPVLLTFFRECAGRATTLNQKAEIQLFPFLWYVFSMRETWYFYYIT